MSASKPDSSFVPLSQFTPTAHKFDVIIRPSAPAANFNYQLSNGRIAILGWVMSKTQMVAKNTDDSETSAGSLLARSTNILGLNSFSFYSLNN